ncbi:hypothetical protein TNCV_3887861 [Trichonephila clavipes]|nr:hypothetical protein TNCV_3887861 [Trichonephila clavipes]
MVSRMRGVAKRMWRYTYASMPRNALFSYSTSSQSFLQVVSATQPQNVWLKHDGAPAYFSIVVCNHLRSIYPGSDEAHFWLNGYVNKQNCRIWSEANPQVYVETQLHPEKLTVWHALWAGGILLQKR